MQIITSFSKQGYEKYGKKFLETYVKHWDHPITVYYEEKPDFEHDLVEYKDLYLVPGLSNFLMATKDLPVCKGVIGDKYNYRYDVWKFCRKSFAQIDAAQYEGPLIWLDADIITHSDVKVEKFISEVYPRDIDYYNPDEKPYMGYLGRPNWHSCASFVVWDTSHPMHKEFMSAYFNLYMTAQILLLPEWHDSYVLDFLRNHLKVPSYNIAEGLELGEGPVNVLPNTVLGKYMDHLKGHRKNSGKSPEEDLKVERSEEYWTHLG